MKNISVCIITKNEEKNLDNCLGALARYPFELIIADTGSTDSTKAVASKYTEHVYDFDWVDDFSAARNFSISKAQNDWVLILDSDEVVTRLDYDALLQFMDNHPDSIGRIERHSRDYAGGTTIDYVERFFDRRLYHYERPIHEQVAPIADTPYSLVAVPVIVNHSGYSTADLARQKSKRNIEMLKESLHTDPDDPYTYFQIGQGYYMIQDFTSAIPYFEKALSHDLDPCAEYVQMMVVSYGYALIYTDRLSDAISFLNKLYSYFENYGDFVYLLGCCYIRSKEYLKAVKEFVRATTLTEYKTEGVTTYLALYNLGLLYECLDEKGLAKKFFEASSSYPPSLEALNRLNAE